MKPRIRRVDPLRNYGCSWVCYDEEIAMAWGCSPLDAYNAWLDTVRAHPVHKSRLVAPLAIL